MEVEVGGIRASPTPRKSPGLPSAPRHLETARDLEGVGQRLLQAARDAVASPVPSVPPSRHNQGSQPCMTKERRVGTIVAVRSLRLAARPRVSGGGGRQRKEPARGRGERSSVHAGQLERLPRASTVRAAAVSLLLLPLLLPQRAAAAHRRLRGRSAHRCLRRPPLPRLPLLPPARTCPRSRDGKGARGGRPVTCCAYLLLRA